MFQSCVGQTSQQLSDFRDQVKKMVSVDGIIMVHMAPEQIILTVAPSINKAVESLTPLWFNWGLLVIRR